MPTPIAAGSFGSWQALDMQTPRTYRSKIGIVWALLAAACVFTLLVGRTLLSQDPAIARGVVAIAVTVAVVFNLFAVPCRYSFGKYGLRVQSGCFIQQLPYSEIEDATPVQDWEWAPALSADRVLLRCRDGSIRLSPVRQHDFLTELRQHRESRLPAGLGGARRG